ncbi:MAG: right-handed parallel beta-helix repeat-containing protein [Planctomycetota bacterium]
MFDRLKFLVVVTFLVVLSARSDAFVWSVSDTAGFQIALRDAQPGDTINVQPGIYAGGHFRAGLTDVTIRGLTGDPRDPAEIVFRGGVNGIQLTDATNVTLQGLTFEQQAGNGLNIDDGGTFATPSTDITLRDVTVRDMNAIGNNDGIKLSGVTGFHLDRVKVFDWGARGSAVDPVGSHHGLIENSHFRSEVLTDFGSVVRPKGGSKAITLRSSLIEVTTGAGRALVAGGSTGSEFFRFIDGDSGYEASEITFVGNRVVGGASSMNWINIDGGVARYNDFRQPSRWAIRILNENPGTAIVDTRNGVFADNYVEFDGSAWSTAVNVGGETDAASFTLARNRWLNTANPTPAGSTPTLPAAETNGEYGVAAPWDEGESLRWQFDWGEWIIPLDADGTEVTVPDFGDYLYAQQLGDAFDPLAAEPLTANPIVGPASATITTNDFSDFALIRPADCPACQTFAFDYDYNGVLNTKDAFSWSQAYGYEGTAPLADGNGDGVVNAIDYALWRDAFDVPQTSVTVPEPTAAASLLATLACWFARACTPGAHASGSPTVRW